MFVKKMNPHFLGPSPQHSFGDKKNFVCKLKYLGGGGPRNSQEAIKLQNFILELAAA